MTSSQREQSRNVPDPRVSSRVVTGGPAVFSPASVTYQFPLRRRGEGGKKGVSGQPLEEQKGWRLSCPEQQEQWARVGMLLPPADIVSCLVNTPLEPAGEHERPRLSVRWEEQANLQKLADGEPPPPSLQLSTVMERKEDGAEELLSILWRRTVVTWVEEQEQPEGVLEWHSLHPLWASQVPSMVRL